jgi:serine protease Do
VVGVNSQIYSRTGGFMGLSFAIPIDVAMDVVNQIKTKGKVSRGWLGVLIQDVTRELAETFGMKQPRGALVAQVLPNSPAAAADLRPGDVILSFNGRDVRPPAPCRHWSARRPWVTWRRCRSCGAANRSS